MSDDLISRSELIKALEKYCGNQPYLVSENIWEIIKNIPNSYDLDKVIEQLKEEGCIIDDAAGNRAVEIIKKGGIL